MSIHDTTVETRKRKLLCRCSEDPLPI